MTEYHVLLHFEDEIIAKSFKFLATNDLIDFLNVEFPDAISTTITWRHANA